MGSAVVDVRDVTVSVGGRLILNEVSVSVGAGELVALIGRNGAGKSTLVRCVAGLRNPTSGSTAVFGRSPDGGSWFWRLAAMVAEEPAWYPGLTVREHVELIRRTHRSSEGVSLPAGEVLSVVGLSERADLPPSACSTGERQRLALAAALVRPSRLLLLDEPEQGLDVEFRDRLADLLRTYAARGGAVVMATHDSALVERTGARSVVIADGRATDGRKGAARAE